VPVLSDKDILKWLRSRDLIVHPILDNKQIHGGKVDLRLDNVFYLIGRFKRPYYDPMEHIPIEGKEPEKYAEKRVMPYGKPFILHPNDYALAPLFEFVKLPKKVIGRLDGRSSLGRLGIVVHSTAGSVDPGYKGHLTMELMNDGMLPVALYPLMRVATLILTTMTSEAMRPYEGKYGKIEDYVNVESQLHRDPELKRLKLMKRYV
jgi:dCTP deaminase